MKITTRLVLQHFLQALLEQLQNNNSKDLDDYFKDFFTKDEIIAIFKHRYGDTISNHLNINPENTFQIAKVLSNADVLSYYLDAWQAERKQQQTLHPVEVMKTLEQLGLPTHYLASKAIAFWDEYDHSNYEALLLKSGKVHAIYGIYDAEITEENLPDVDSPPKRFYETYGEAKAVMETWIADGKYTEDEIHVLPLLVGDA